MWLPLTLLVLVGAVAADFQHGWKVGDEYHYLVRSRTFAGLDQLAEQYTGILIKARLTVQATDPQTLRAKVSKTQYAHVHKELPHGWDSEISDQMLELRDLPMSDKPFEIKMKHGVIRDLIVDRDVPTWEVNVLKSIISQLQVDTQGENIIRSKSTQVPQEDQPYAMFKAMEDTVGGKCEVIYDITPLPEEVRQSQPELVPMPELKGEGQHLDIIKTKNYSRCDQRMDYHYHFANTGKTNWEPGTNDNGRFLSKSSTSRIIISGDLKQFTIQSSVTTNKMFVSPRFYDQQSGVVASKMNLTLANIVKVSNPLPAPSNPESTGNLVYTYNNPFSNSEHRRPGRPTISQSSKPDSESSSASSSEEARKNGQKGQDSSSSSSSSSSSAMSSENNNNDFWQPKPTLEDAPANPLLPFFIGNKGKAIGMSNEVDAVKVTKDLVLQIASELEDASNIPEQDTLEKFTILSSLLRTMSRKQIAEAEGNLHQTSNELKSNDRSQAKKQNAWAVFRDAVAQAGTGPALMTIKNWIHDQKIQGMEAAEVVGSIPKTARAPTPEYVQAFFEMATNSEVVKQRFLNSSAIVAFAELVRNSQISRRSMHNLYPVHSFGNLAPKNNQAVIEEYIPYLARELKEAIKNGDRLKTQVYIMALGHIGHPKILAIFEPYLEGKEQVSTFQRTMMVAAMANLAKLNPKLARSVLYKIYLNTMEAHEVRCMAVYLIMMTDPPLSMLQRMATFTKFDTNKHVNSAVKSIIESIAELDRPEHRDLANRARAARNLLNSKEYSRQYSQAYVTDALIRNKNLAYVFGVNYIGSDDSVIPRAWYVALDTTYGDFDIPRSEFSMMVSNVKALLNKHLFKKNDGERSEKSAVEQIAEALNIHSEEQAPLEGNVYVNNKYGMGFWTFDRNTIERIPDWAMQRLSSLKNGGYVNLNKLQSYEVTLSFPTETGLPFVYTMKIPTLMKVSGNAEVQVGPHFTVKAKSEFRLLVSKKIQGRFGFVAPFEHQQFIAGVDMNIQSYIPAKLEVDLNGPKKNVQLKLWPLKGEQKAKILHYSIVPYTSRHNILTLRPILSEKNTQKVHTSEPQQLSQSLSLSKAGNAFRLDVQADKLSEDLLPNQEGESYSIDDLAFPFSQHNDKYRKMDVSMNLEHEQKDPIILTATYDSVQADASSNSQDWSSEAKAVPASKVDPDSEERRQQYLKEAAKGIHSAKASVVDLRLETPGQVRCHNAMTLAWARSNIEDKTRALIFWHFEHPEQKVKYEICAAGQSNQTPNSRVGFEPIRNKPKRDFNAEVRYGERCTEGGRIVVNGKQTQSNELRNRIEQSNVVKKCQEQMKQGNKALRQCQEANVAAMTLDEMDVSMEINSKPLQMVANKALDIVKNMGSSIVRTDVTDPKNSGKDKIDVKVRLSQDLKKAEINVHTPLLDAVIPDVDISALKIAERSGLSNERDEEPLVDEYNRFSCVLDKTQAETFDGRAYPLKLGKCWHAAIATFPKREGDGRKEFLPIPEDMKVSVLARDSDDGKDVKIILGEKEIHLTASGSQPQVTVNGQKVHHTREASHQEKKGNEIEFEISELQDGSIWLTSDKYNVEATYDGKRIDIKASQKFRTSVRGLCGNFDGEAENDFTTPKNCMVQRPEDFVATYALTKDQCQGPALENARRAEKAPCTRLTPRQSNVISDLESGKIRSEGRNWGYHAGEQKDTKHCNTYRTKVIEVEDKLCFTIRPVPFCARSCSATETTMKNYQFTCMPKNEASLEAKKRVEKGANPDFSQKAPSLTKAIEVPLTCAA